MEGGRERQGGRKTHTDNLRGTHIHVRDTETCQQYESNPDGGRQHMSLRGTHNIRENVRKCERQGETDMQ